MADCIDMWTLLYATNPNAYYGNYYVLLIPIGAIICFAIKRLSDLESLNKGVSIRADCDLEGVAVLKVDMKLFQSVLKRIKMFDNSMLVVEGMAVKLSEFSNAMDKELGRTLQESDLLKCTKPIMRSNAIVHRDLICSSETPYLEANARAYYDLIIKNAVLNIKKKMGAAEFLKSYEFICYADLGSNLIKYRFRIGRIKIGVLNDTERSALVCSEALYDSGSALLLFLRLNNSIEVIDC